MHAYGHYLVGILGNDDEVSKGMNFLKETTSEDFDINPFAVIDENYEVVWIYDIIDMAIEMAKKIPNSKFVLSGFVDCTESCGEVMQFGILYENGEIKIYNTDWVYLEEELEETYYNIDSAVTDDVTLIEDYFKEIVSDIISGTWDNVDTIDIST